MTRLEFLNDMINWYTEDVTRRSTNGSSCLYMAEDGRKCAIGRYIKEEDVKQYELESLSVSKDLVFNCLPEEIQYLGVDFLIRVQKLHDDSSYWNKKGLTKRGLKFVEEIKQEFC